MSLFRAAKWRNHPMLQISKSSMLFGLPTGIVMFATVVAAEATGLIKVDAKSVQRTGGFGAAMAGQGEMGQTTRRIERNDASTMALQGR